MQIFDRLHGFVWDSMGRNNCNTYLINGPTPVLIDPGHLGLFGHVHKGLSEAKIGIGEIGLVISTHAHPDHAEAIKIFEREPALFTLHETEWTLAKSVYVEAFGIPLNVTEPDFFLKQGDLSVEGLELEVLHTPGHSPGSVSIYWPRQKALFTGDVIFKGGLGRTDLPGGDSSLLKDSIRRLSELDIEWILPGHGEVVAGANAVKLNFKQLEQVWFNYL